MASKILDLTIAPVHPIVRLPEGDFEMRTAEELTFEQFGRQISIGKELTERAPEVGEPGVLEDLQKIVVEAAHIILIDLTDKAAENLTPGRYLKINDFFHKQAKEKEQPENESGLTSAPDVKDSSEIQAAD